MKDLERIAERLYTSPSYRKKVAAPVEEGPVVVNGIKVEFGEYEILIDWRGTGQYFHYDLDDTPQGRKVPQRVLEMLAERDRPQS